MHLEPKSLGRDVLRRYQETEGRGEILSARARAWAWGCPCAYGYDVWLVEYALARDLPRFFGHLFWGSHGVAGHELGI